MLFLRSRLRYILGGLRTSIRSKADYERKMPITVLSGFLGAGKTTFLQHALTNDTGKKFGLLVNDMASVNVDSKLVKKTSAGFSGVDTLELQNGCVCCTLADDLLMSVNKLVQVAEEKNAKYDHIIVECSGIAEPRKIADTFRTAELSGESVMKKVSLDTLVTVVDATAFLRLFGTDVDMKSNRDLAIPEDGKNAPPMDDIAGMRRVTDLLLEQVEFADIVLINKIDLLSHPSNIELVTKVVKSMNPTAQVQQCVRGGVDPVLVVGSAGGAGAAQLGILEQHRELVRAVDKDSARSLHDPTHDHSHKHDHATCNDPTHDHSHNHDHATCNDPTHDHSHNHDHATCNDPTHDHSHNHDHATCNDPTHDHSHNHDHASEATTAETRFGITSFVYKRRRPFHPIRFTDLLNDLGHLSVKGLFDLEYEKEKTAAAPVPVPTSTTKSALPTALDDAKRSLLRSKGFVWMATSSAGAYYMSHAGQYLELVVLGRWWAAMDEQEWPETSKEEVLADFDKVGKHGDRRQEIVLIGQFSDNKALASNARRALEDRLDTCLLTDTEMAEYERLAPEGDKALKSVFLKHK